jgi:hypothetical protein
MLVWFKEKKRELHSLINVEQIVRIEANGDFECCVHLADGQKIYVSHSLDSIEETLGEVTDGGAGKCRVVP